MRLKYIYTHTPALISIGKKNIYNITIGYTYIIINK